MSGRIEQIGDATLYLGDCREILPTLSEVDATITDPPFGVRFSGKIEHDGRRASGAYEAFADDDPIYIIDRVKMALSISRRAAMTPGTRIMWQYPEPRDFGVFFVPGGVGMGRWGFCCAHPILYYGMRPSRPGLWPTSREYRIANPSTSDHPTAKPNEWMMMLVNIASTVGETVLDPFMGSGTTGVACARLGRKFVGIEIEPKYFAVACRRIEDAYRQPDMLIRAAQKSEQPALDI